MSSLDIFNYGFNSLFNITDTSDPADENANFFINAVGTVAFAFFAAKSVYDHFRWSGSEFKPSPIKEYLQPQQPQVETLEEEEEDFIPDVEKAETRPLSEKFSDPLNDEVIHKVNQARAEGKKVTLVVGRHDSEPLPQAEDVTVYVSLDERPRFNEKPSHGRLHLEMEIDAKHDFSPLHGLFDTVIVDFSTMKSVYNWDILKPLLHPSPDSTLITEIPTVTFGMIEQKEKAERQQNLKRPHFYVPEHEMNRRGLRDKREKAQIKAKTSYLKQLFGNVEVLENAPYPTRTAKDFGHRPQEGQGLQANLFVMKNPL